LGLLRFIIGEGHSGEEGKALGDHWKLDRKLREALELMDIPGDEAYRLMELAKAVLARTGPEHLEVRRGLSAAAIILENYESEDFRRLLRINLFEDVTWFNKEAFEEALFYVPFFLAVESESAFREAVKPSGKRGKPAGKPAKTEAAQWLSRVGIIADLADQFRNAEAGSGYRLDRLMEGLSGNKAGSAGRGGKAPKSGKKANPGKRKAGDD
jgi:hypothetical protein